MGDYEEEVQERMTFVRLSIPLHERIRERAREEGVSMNKLMRFALYRFLGINKRKDATDGE